MFSTQARTKVRKTSGVIRSVPSEYGPSSFLDRTYSYTHSEYVRLIIFNGPYP
ncbi:hypothetical protein F7D09_2057 [Bifidobacterium leontopitheci]|uniref:Uncharacterized protein n=1 Tax=Bifidobacterium leontopitheci TaxID=2650774 RepID=A0A6I1GBM4_9BIFI|nr:hypothetical protein F7D09_2057 [Bifidobacterium leontopitheci]